MSPHDHTCNHTHTLSITIHARLNAQGEIPPNYGVVVYAVGRIQLDLGL